VGDEFERVLSGAALLLAERRARGAIVVEDGCPRAFASGDVSRPCAGRLGPGPPIVQLRAVARVDRVRSWGASAPRRTNSRSCFRKDSFRPCLPEKAMVVLRTTST